jgi:tRNA(Ile) lysidine synthetase-like protein
VSGVGDWVPVACESAGVSLSDEEIAEMSPAERRELVRRLVAARGLAPSRRTIERIRKWRLAVLVVCVVTLIPWTVYLGATLPGRYVARNWVATWVGFDILLMAMLAATAIAGWRRRQLVFPTAFASGVLLICDAWFDVMTSQPGADLIQALVSALVLEIPLGIAFIAGPLRLMRIVALRHGLVEPGTRMWRVPIPMPELWPDQPATRE